MELSAVQELLIVYQAEYQNNSKPGLSAAEVAPICFAVGKLEVSVLSRLQFTDV